MEKFVILADVTCDMSQEIRDYFGVTDYIRGYVHFSDGRDFKTSLDWDTISREDFYRALSDRQMKVSTAPASPEEYYEVFRRYAEDGYDVLSISISDKVSTTYASAKKAVDRIAAEFPERHAYALDSRRMSGAFGLLVAYAHEMRRDGKGFLEVVDRLEDLRDRLHQMGPIDDLVFVARRGRISTGKAIMGSFAGVKPMGDCNADGYVTVLTKAKGMKKALATTVAYIAHAAVDIENQYVFITHSNRETYAEQLRVLVEEALHPKKVFVSDVFCASGTNIGPGMVCAYFVGDPISADGEQEKEIMARAVEDCR